ncbi:ArnT family glycosyltransferase [Pontibacter locisalis]|uniref:ArnT family glycosyltransferase n=1 Tax=Pontibacter locisalis TaxID=1719035 RepID=A0ABW5IMM0_9BACT
MLRALTQSHYRSGYLAVSLFILVVIIRLLTVQRMGLMPQDAYYYYYSEHLALSYYDHPPMIAYLLRLFTEIFSKDEVIIKLANAVTTVFSLVAFYFLAKQFLPRHRAGSSLVLLGSTVMVTNLSLVSLPDVPLVLFWTLSLLLLHKAIHTGSGFYWALAGITVGLSFNSKYTAVFLLLGLVLFLLLSSQHRKYVFSRQMLLLLIFLLLTVSPVVMWNLQNDWISFEFQSSNRMSSIAELNLSPRFFFGNIGAQLLLLMPVLFVAMFVVFWKVGKKAIVKRSMPDSDVLFLLCFFLPIVGFFFTLSSVYLVKSNWLMPAYIAAVVLIGIYLTERHVRYHLAVSVVLHVLLLVQVVFYPVPVKSDDTWWGWDQLAAEVEILRERYPNHFIVSDDGYKTAAVLNFYMKEDVYAGNVLGKNGLQFSLTHADLSHLKNNDALFIDSNNSFTDTLKSNEIERDLLPYFDQVKELSPIVITDEEGKPVRKFLVFECRNYRYDQLVQFEDNPIEH